LPWTLAAAIALPLVWSLRVTRGARAQRDARPTVLGEGFPCTVRTPDGIEFALAAPPRRLVLASAAVVDLVLALADESRVAAMCDQARTFADAVARGALAATPTYRHFTAETALRFAPDLVLCSPFNAPETTAALARAAVAVVSVPSPTDLAGVEANVRLLGRLLGAEDRAAALIAEVGRRAEALAATAPRRAHVRALFYTNNGAGGWTGGRGTLHQATLALAGLRDAASEGGIDGHVRIDFERLLALDPDVLIVDGRFGEAPGGTEVLLRGEPALAQLSAVREGRIVALHPALHAAESQHMVTAAEHIAAAVDRYVAASTREPR
jgi:iron complex transport system substrate-binding protein